MKAFLFWSTLACLGVAALIAIIWLISKKRGYDSAITILVLIASISGIYGQLWLNSQERRAQFFALLAQEIQVNKLIINSPPFLGSVSANKIFSPRLLTDAADAFISSGEFASESDSPFVYHLYRYRQVIRQVNRKINAIELKLFILSPNKELNKTYFEALCAADGPIGEVRTELDTIDANFKKYYPRDYLIAENVRFGRESAIGN